MTRVDKDGIPCIVQSMKIQKSKKIYTVIKAVLFDGSVITVRSDGFKFLLQRGYKPNDCIFDDLYRSLEASVIDKYVKRKQKKGFNIANKYPEHKKTTSLQEAIEEIESLQRDRSIVYDS